TGEDRGRLSYAGTFRRPGSRAALQLDGLASGIERTNFFGYGNETEKPESKQAYRTLESFLAVTPSLRLERSRQLQLSAGATLRVSDTPDDRPNVLNQVDAYGGGAFREAGLRAGVHYDSRGVGEGLLSGGLFETVGQGAGGRADLRVEAEASWFPAWLDVEDAFGAVAAEVAGYLGRSRSPVQLAVRVGGRRVWGTYPWFESAFIGGRASVRGYSRQRFAGDRSLYGGVEARAWLFTMDVPPIPLRVGVLGFADVGRVWLAGEDSDVWHPSGGGGLMLQPVATPFVLTAAVASGKEGSRWYFGYGFFF
ncbi:MAG TPA: BamA/TamA family outer membrane protein, partial [Vicinamibacteria bacterium]|nr:BamA/TamA family outer membrane protein [Vicinamibacteria bacterium]